MVIDVSESIKSRRLIYQATFWQLLWAYLSLYLTTAGKIAFFYLLLLNTLFEDYPIHVICVLIPLTFFVLLNAYFIEKLYVVKGMNERSNLGALTKNLTDNYRKIKIEKYGSKVLIGKTDSWFWAFERNFTILFKDEYVAINLSVLGRGGLKYCLVGMYNYYRCKKILGILQGNYTV